MRLNKLMLAFGIIASFTGVANAQDVKGVKDKQAVENITKFVAESNSKLKGIYETGIPDFYEVVVEPADVIYINKDVNKLFLNGALLDIERQVNMTEERKEKALAFSYSDLPKTGFIEFGKGKKEIAVFADPNCGFCKKYEQTLEEQKDLKVRVYPIAILSPTSLEINRNIMCSANPQKSWKDWMINGIKPAAAKECKNNGDTNTEFAKSKVIQSTPTTVFKNGTRKSGAMDAEMLKEELEKRK